MSGTNYIASNWRTPENSNSSKNDNYSLYIDGSSANIVASHSTDLDVVTGNHSLAFWMKANVGTTTVVMEKGRGDELAAFIISNRIYWGGVNAFYGGSANINDNNWHHFVFVATGATSQIWIDGSLVATGGNKVEASANTEPFTMGTDANGNNSFTGLLSEVSIFNYALDENQITTLYGNATSGAGNPMALKPTPVGYWPLGDNSASDPLAQPNVAVEDASVFSFDGVDDKIELNSQSFGITGAISVSAWVKIPTTNTGGASPFIQNIVGEDTKAGTDRNWALFWRGGTTLNGFSAFIYDSSGAYVSVNSALPTPNDNNWHNLMFTYTGDTSTDGLKLFVDGVQIAQATSSNSGLRASTSVIPTIGGVSNTIQRMFEGNINEVSIFNSVQDASTIYNSGVPGDISSLNPLAWYKLDQSANWEADTVGTWQIPDAVSEFPQSFDFDGINDEINAGDILHNDGQTPMTVSAWINVSTDGDYPIAGKKKVRGAPGYLRQGWDITLDTSGLSKNKLTFTLIGATSGSVGLGVITAKANGFDFNDGLWHHVVVAYDGSEDASGVKFYRDGFEDTNIQIISNTFSGNSPNVSSVDFKIGTKPEYSGSSFYDGELSNVQVWDVALTGEKIITLYNGGTPTLTPPNQSDLKGSWRLDNTATFSTNWTVPDASGNGNDGTSSGMTEQSLVNNNVSTLNGESSGMTSGNLVLSDLTRNLPYENYSLSFDSGVDYVECGNISGLNGGLTEATWSGWFNRSSSGGFYIMGTYGVGQIQFFVFQGNNYVTAYAGSSAGAQRTMAKANVTAWTTNQWYHLTFVYNESEALDSDKMKIYVDGILQANAVAGAALTNLNSSTANFDIGRLTGTASTQFVGKISNVAIWNNGLSSTEVQNLYANGMPQDLTTFTPQPINWWTLGKESFWDGADWVIRDMIGTNDGLSSNMGGSELKGDAPRSQANGVGTNIAVPTDLKGNAGWSDKNGYSINMSSTARTTDTP